MKVGVITASDKGSRGQRVDESGPLAAKLMEQIGGETLEILVLPDDVEALSAGMIRMADALRCDIILTSGGTGFSPRDVTPEATAAVCDRMAPGIGEAMRAESMKVTNRAMLSRATAGIRGKTLIVNLPGSPKGVRECLTAILPALPHAVEILNGGGECAKA